jgi:hypothetical protein
MLKKKLKYALYWVIGYVNDNKDMDEDESMLKVATTQMHGISVFLSFTLNITKWTKLKF